MIAGDDYYIYIIKHIENNKFKIIDKVDCITL